MVEFPESVHIDFRSEEEIRQKLGELTIPIVGTSEFDGHLEILRELAVRLGSNSNAVQNALYLAKGYRDLAVVLQEPSDIEERALYEDMDLNMTTEFPLAISVLHKSLRFASQNRRDVKNTIILDSRPLRFREPRKRESRRIRDARDRYAYAALKQMLHIIRPKVILVCQCDKGGVSLGLPEYLCSSTESTGFVKAVKMGTGHNGHECLTVSSFHPSSITREAVGRKAVARQDLFDTSLVVAVNALVGCKVYGESIWALRNMVRKGYHLREALLEVPVAAPSNYASPQLIQRLKEIGCFRDEELLDDYRIAAMRLAMRPCQSPRGA
ncbi:uncharacterized protein DNG_07004 [Cephalotrichum gorgonifer]|uniref:Uncharacterized protein n=1 Tax=Cephalotrichum gorgonifer TaxID=2041049 RepID=A0AAE8SWZ9_9PEZI|nr:uncharacterized protein DNG_07004 [Cephalotrichum gorgonifer]